MTACIRLLALLVVSLTTACALVQHVPDLPDMHEVKVRDAVFLLEYEDVDAATAREVADSLNAAVPRVERWGTFAQPITIRIHPTHEALEAAAHRIDYPWLRAWSRYDNIELQSPRTWSLLGATPAQVTELLTHELTHCLMYQRSGTGSDWMRKGIPLWFREGMASVTASQGYRRPTEEELWRYLKANPQKDPVRDADDIYQTESDIVYGAAHRSFEFLVERYGDEAVKSLMAAMASGERFDAAFLQVTGVATDSFTREYVRYVRWEGWRGEKLRRVAGPLVPAGKDASQGAAGDTKPGS